MKKLLLALGFVGCTLAVGAQELVSIELRGVVPSFLVNQLLGSLDLPNGNGIQYYRVLYTMPNLAGEPDTVSGLFVRPSTVLAGQSFPRLVWQHGTTQTKNDVPSNTVIDQQAVQNGALPDASLLFGAVGYAAVAPDFLNMGQDQEGFHPYVHAETEALAAIYMLQALESAPEYTDVVGDELYITGYSQGGHASMALHEVIVEDFDDEFDVTAGAHLSGPYSISDVMTNDVILKDSTFVYFGFLPYTVLSYQAVYPEIEQDLSRIFRAPYVDTIRAFRDGYADAEVSLGDLTFGLLGIYQAVEGDQTFFPRRMLTPEFEAELRDPNSTISRVLRDNDTYDFVNPDPTRLFYCMADDQVSFRNSIVAEDTLQQLGATDTEAINLVDTANHTECIIPALLATLDFFEAVQQTLGTQGTIPGASGWQWAIRENRLRVFANAGETYQLTAIDALGRSLASQPYVSGELVELTGGAGSWVAVQLTDSEGRREVRKLVLR